jgi:CheY-like chemotaxis protein
VAEPAIGRSTVLVVDDDEELRATFAELLASSGYLVEQARNGRDGLAYCIEVSDEVIKNPFRKP